MGFNSAFKVLKYFHIVNIALTCAIKT